MAFNSLRMDTWECISVASGPGVAFGRGRGRSFKPNRRFFGRTNLWISVSRAKFGVEADFEVRSWLLKNHTKSRIHECFVPKLSPNEFFVENGNVWNRLKRVLAKFRADPSHVPDVPAPGPFDPR